MVEDLTTGLSGFMVASAANGFQNTDPDSCAPTSFDFHPEYDTAKFGNFVPWAVLQANINFSMETGHFTPGPNGDGDAFEAPCFPGPTRPGCIGADIDFDGTSYLRDWPDGTRAHATSIAIGSVAGEASAPSASRTMLATMTSRFRSFSLRLPSRRRSHFANLTGSAASFHPQARNSIHSIRSSAGKATTGSAERQ